MTAIGRTSGLAIRVLLIQADRSDYELVRNSLSGVNDAIYQLDWVQSREDAERALRQHAHDVTLVDHRLIGAPGFDSLREVATAERRALVVVAGKDEVYQAEQAAAACDADGFYCNDQPRPEALYRCIRRAIETRRFETTNRRTSSDLLNYIARMREAHFEISAQRQRIISLARHLAAAKPSRLRRASPPDPSWSTAVGRWCFDSTLRTSRANAETWRIFEVENSAELAGRTIESLTGPDGAVQLRAALANLAPGEEVTEELALLGQRSGRKSRVVLSVLRSDTSDDEPRYAAQLVDITDNQNRDDSFRVLARFDGLTGLHSRASFAESLRQAIASASRAGTSFAVLRIDLKGFEGIGELQDDRPDEQLALEIGRRIKAAIRSSDTAARLTGGAFAVLAVKARDDRDLSALAERLLKELNRPLLVAGKSLAFDAALGIALYPTDARDGGQLVERAELALHRAQRTFGRKWHFHDDAMQDRALRRAVVAEQLDGALLDGAFSFAIEPIFAAPQGRACATEALIRWRLADGSLLRASEFIPAVESSGRIVTLGEWALPAACRQFTESRDYAPDLSLVLNVSDAELAGPTFLGLIDRSLASTDLSPRQVRLDVAARRGLAERPNLLRRLFDIRERGIQLAFDGFTGREASLHQMQDLPFHQIKLHQDLVESALGSSADRGRFHAMVGYCRALGMAVAAKGVETERHLELVLEAGCDEMQGRLLTPPSLQDGSGMRFAGRL